MYTWRKNSIRKIINLTIILLMIGALLSLIEGEISDAILALIVVSLELLDRKVEVLANKIYDKR